MAISTIFSVFSFVKNVGKLRKTAIDYFKSEGIKCEVKDGELLFWFKDNVYTLQLCEGDDMRNVALYMSAVPMNTQR